MRSKTLSAFTIVELLIVIVVIAILAAIAIVGYSGISNQAKESSIKSELGQIARKLEVYKVSNDNYPSGNVDSVFSSIGYSGSEETDYVYTLSSGNYCLSASRSNNVFRITNIVGSPEEGDCGDGSLFIQTINRTNCPADRTMAVDARDGRTYWVQELADGNCWMLTNLAYAGGGSDAYNDTMAIQDGTSDPTPLSSTEPKYYIPPNANPTNNPTEPSVNTAGGGTVAAGERQYGYLYNWCAAMGGQPQACQTSLGSNFTSESVCPANWRLPTGSGVGDFAALNDAVNDGALNTDEGLRTNWLAQRAGFRSGASVVNQGMDAYFWSSTQSSANIARQMYASSTQVSPSATIYNKNAGFSVRCLAV